MEFVFVDTATLCPEKYRNYSEEQLLFAISAVKSGWSIREVGRAKKMEESAFRLHMKPASQTQLSLVVK
jgi:hypothetical protein